jgi:hypothetical protein
LQSRLILRRRNKKQPNGKTVVDLHVIIFIFMGLV